MAPNIDGGAGNQYGKMLPWKFYRLAEIYLNLAEAAAEANHPAEARAAVNAVRARVQMPAITTETGEALIMRIRNERRVELAWEEARYFDLRRWQKPDGDLHETCAWLTVCTSPKMLTAHSNTNAATYGTSPVAALTTATCSCPFRPQMQHDSKATPVLTGKTPDGNRIFYTNA